MSRIVDDDPPIKTGASTQAYRDGWERMFGDAKPEACPDTIEVRVRSRPRAVVWERGVVLSAPCPLCPLHTRAVVTWIDYERGRFGCTDHQHPFEDLP